MKALVIFSFVIMLGFFGPQRAITSNLEPLWILGMVGIVAFLFHQFCQRLHLAPVAGWLCAGVFLGVGGLKILAIEEGVFGQIKVVDYLGVPSPRG